MKVIEEKVGDTVILIQAIEDNLDIVGQVPASDRATQPTRTKDRMLKAYSGIKSAIGDIARDIGMELATVATESRPKTLEMEFSLGISAQAGTVLVLSGKAEYALKIKMIWEL